MNRWEFLEQTQGRHSRHNDYRQKDTDSLESITYVRTYRELNIAERKVRGDRWEMKPDR